jgi:RNA polymerase-binding transcription factor DksA
MADQGTDTIDRELGALDASRLSRELEEIDAALDRLYRDPDNFGRDERTGAEIPFERLDVIPWARTSVNRPSPSDASASRGSEAPELPGP